MEREYHQIDHRTLLSAYEEAVASQRRAPSIQSLQHAEDAIVRLHAALFLPGRFELGQIVATPGALTALYDAGQIPAEFLLRHKHADWGALDAEDIKANETALRSGLRLLSSYSTRFDEQLWLITEADRSATTILLPDEY
jgi:hypothetical protein